MFYHNILVHPISVDRRDCILVTADDRSYSYARCVGDMDAFSERISSYESCQPFEDDVHLKELGRNKTSRKDIFYSFKLKPDKHPILILLLRIESYIYFLKKLSQSLC